ncbi:putative beta-farnesene synthase [Helianthus debilis subsp. tardiflorus]
MYEKGNFKESLCEDAQGLLALYEASYMRVEGEKVLDDALKFTKTHLAIISKGSFLRLFIESPNTRSTKAASPEKVAKARGRAWWKDLDMQKKLPYVRDRLIEGYFWILVVYFEPQHSHTRIFLMKTSMWLIVLDDTYDNYGTYEELKIFTDAVQRWSMSCLDLLPDYMKLIYQELLNHYKEIVTPQKRVW